MSLLRGVRRSPLGGAGAAARGGLPLPTSCLATLRSRFSSSYPTAAGTTTGQTLPDPRAETRPASARERDAHDLASPRPRVPRSSRPFGGIADAPGRENNPDAIELARFAVAEHNKTVQYSTGRRYAAIGPLPDIDPIAANASICLHSTDVVLAL